MTGRWLWAAGLFSALASLGSGQASAADLPVKAPVTKAPVAALYDWSGVYIGGSVGWAHTDADWHYTNAFPPLVPFSLTDDSVIYGGHIGAQYQWSQYVFGVEAALNGLDADAKGCGPEPVYVGDTCEVRIRQIGTVGGKLGWAGWNSWLIYAQGGYAWATVDSRVFFPGFDDPTSHHHSGWYAGAGLDYVLYRIAPADIIVGVDYQHIDLGAERHASSFDGFNPTGPNTRDIKAIEDIVRLKLSLKFNPWRHGPL